MAIVDKTLDRKFADLKKLVSGYGSLIVAYSGGVDSTFLAAVAHEVLGFNTLSVTSRSPSVAPEELEAAIALARTRGWRHLVVDTNEIEDPRYLANDGRRCFFCKTELYTHLGQVAAAEGITKVANGANTDDLGDYRPGMEAAKNFEVISPLVEVGMSKQDIRDVSRCLDLPTWDKPAQPCLSSRIPYGTVVSVGALAMIGKSEKGLRELGFSVVRVRHYGQTARVEIPIDDFERFEYVRSEAERIVLASGYKVMELDPKGFRSGALNDALRVSVSEAGSVNGSK